LIELLEDVVCLLKNFGYSQVNMHVKFELRVDDDSKVPIRRAGRYGLSRDIVTGLRIVIAEVENHTLVRIERNVIFISPGANFAKVILKCSANCREKQLTVICENAVMHSANCWKIRHEDIE
jgi:hypothetical protein